MLKNFGTGYCSVFIDVAYYNYGNAVSLGFCDKLHCRLLYLCNSSGRRHKLVVIHGLNGIDYHDIGRITSISGMILFIFVSARTEISSPDTSRRRARSFICDGDSSPETYSTRFPSQSVLQTCKSKVDFPIPGSPTTERPSL